MNCIENNKKIYEALFEKYGDDLRSLRWGNPEAMLMRHKELAKIGDLQGASLLDIGCGLGDFYQYITQTIPEGEIKPRYKGIDLIEGMVKAAAEKYPKASFEARNILEHPVEERFDYVFLSGIFGDSGDDNQSYMERMLKEAFSICTKGLAFHFVSTYANYYTEGHAYYNPCEVLRFCIENLSPKVKLHHHFERCETSVFVYR